MVYTFISDVFVFYVASNSTYTIDFLFVALFRFQGESSEPSSNKLQLSRKHGMQSLGKVPNARRPANLPSLKTESGQDPSANKYVQFFLFFFYILLIKLIKFYDFQF